MRALSIVRKHPEATYMPLVLKGVMANRGLKQSDLAVALRQKNGRPLSPSALSHLVNWNVWPKETTPEVMRQAIEQWLSDHGVPREEIATVWNIDSEDTLRGIQPVGIKVGRPHKLKIVESDIEPLEVEMLSSAAKRLFGLFRDPFQDDVNSPDDVFLSADQRYISEAMFQTAKHGGFLAVIGESGSGKTTLRKLLIERIRDQSIRIIFPQTVDKSQMTTSNLCQAIIGDLAPGQTIKSSREAQARQVKDVLLQSSRADNSHVLVIEEAHDLSIATLKYLKRFYELEDGFKKLLSIVLIAQPEMKDKLNESNYPAAREVIRRIEIAELLPLDGNVEDYLALKFKRVGKASADIFAKDSYDAIRARLTKVQSGSREVYSQLYPLGVNTLVTKAMNRAAKLGAPLISADLVREL